MEGPVLSTSYERIHNTCNHLHEDDASRNPDWQKLGGWGGDQFWAWDQLDVSTATNVAYLQTYFGWTADDARFIGFYDGTGDECERATDHFWMCRFLTYWTLAALISHTW